MKDRTIRIVTLFLLLLSLGMGPKVNTTESGNRKEPLFWPPPPYEPRIEFLYSISRPDDFNIKKGFFRRLWEFVAGEQRHAIIKPMGVYADEKGRVYVTDLADSSVHVFDPANKGYFAIRGDTKRPLLSPVGVTADDEGTIYISDTGARRIYLYDEKGKYKGEIGSDDRLQRPTGIAFDRKTKSLYVVDTVSCTVNVFSPDGRYLRSFGAYGSGNGQFNRPTFIALGKDGHLYIADSMNVRVQILDRNGQFIAKFGKRGDGTGDMANPRGIALDSEGHIYLTDTLFEVTQVFDASGRILLVFGKRGTGSGEFSIPAGIAISRDDRIYIADSYNSRVQVFRYLKEGDPRLVRSPHTGKKEGEVAVKQ